MANFMKMMKQAADMQKNMAKAQEALAALELEHSAGGGAVRGAQDQARETAATEMKKLTAGLNLPPGFGL